MDKFSSGSYQESGMPFVDFVPYQFRAGGVFRRPHYEDFSACVERANEWLGRHPNVRVVNCESVTFKLKNGRLEKDNMVYVEYGDFTNTYLRGLRLWLSENTGKAKYQQIGYFNWIPQLLKKGGIFSESTFESLDDVVARFNLMTKTNPIQGSLITVETLALRRMSADQVFPDESYWEEGSLAGTYLFVLRVFFEISEENVQEIKITDFVPERISEGRVVTLPKYADFQSVVEQASTWCRTQYDGMSFCNAQSVRKKVTRGNDVDTQAMTYTENISLNTYYMRLLRVVHTTRSHKEGGIEGLTCKTFRPVQLTRGSTLADFEGLDVTKKRVDAWVKATGARVLSAETSSVQMYIWGEDRFGKDSNFTYTKAEDNEYWIRIIRLYIDGPFQEPAAGLLPPLPRLKERKLCILS